MAFMLNLVTDDGDVDVAFAPAGPLDGYSGWNVGAFQVEIAPALTVRIAALDDIISSKRGWAGRAKDLHAVPYSKSLRDEIAAGRPDEPH